ncbi:MAG TPA: hypothetical protein VEJ38_07365 [Candidatus Acidoferrales bacterium]|nr:hypothetical protein [Candidatus Acidoferrales bacterium]
MKAEHVKSSNAEMGIGEKAFESTAGQAEKLDLKHPDAVLSLLEADQVVAAKQRMHFGRRKLSVGVRMLLWGLRIYVVAMLVIVLISAFRAIHSAP